MTKIFLIVVLFFSAVCTKAQSIPLPDNVGKYLFDLMINRQDISKSSISVDLNHYSNLYKEISLPILEKALIHASGNEKIKIQIEIDNINQMAEFYYTRNIDNWAGLMLNADNLNLIANTATYHKTYFRLRQNQENKYPYGIDLYIGFNHKGNIYTFHAIMQWIDKRWVVMETDPNIYRYMQNKYDEVVFFPETKTEDIPEELNYQYNTEITSPMTDDTKTIASPDTFNKKILELLKEGALFGSNQNFIDENEYMVAKGNAIIKQLEKKLDEGAIDEHHLEEVNTYLNDHSLLFRNNVEEPWMHLPKALQEEFNEDISDLQPYETETEIQNWDNKFIEMENITVRTNMSFEQGDHKAGILFEAIWHNGMWKLSYLQAFPYGISAAESVSMDETIDIEEDTSY